MFNCSYHGPYSGTKCPDCERADLAKQQNSLLEKQIKASEDRASERASRERWEAEEARRSQAQQDAVLLSLEILRLAEEQKRTRITLESTFTEQEAYDRGYSWQFAFDQKYENGLLQGTLNLDGSLHFDSSDFEEHDKPYILDKLIKAFNSGVQKRLDEELGEEFTVDLTDMIAGARNVGLAGGKASLLKAIPPFLEGSNFIFSLHFSADTYNSMIDELSGETLVKIEHGNKPFDERNSTEAIKLNEAYFEGLSDYVAEFLSEENKVEKVSERAANFAEVRRLAERKKNTKTFVRSANIVISSAAGFYTLFNYIIPTWKWADGNIILMLIAIGVICVELSVFVLIPVLGFWLEDQI